MEINESYLIKDCQTKVASCLTALMHDLGGWVDWVPGAWGNTRLVNSSQWRKNEMLFITRWDHDDRKHEFIEFFDCFYNEGSKVDYGTPILLQNVDDVDSPKTKIYTNKTPNVIQVSYEEAVELSNSVSHTMTSETHMDVTSEQTVSGEYAGISAEAKFSQSFGVSFSNEETKEQSKMESESVTIEFEVNPEEYIMVEVTKEHERLHTPFYIDGILDFQIMMRFYHWMQRNRHGSYRNFGTCKVNSVNDLEQFVKGYDTDYPSMQGYWDHGACSRVKNGLNWIFDANNRAVKCSGIKERILEKNVDYKITKLGSQVPPNLAHLPIVDADAV